MPIGTKLLVTIALTAAQMALTATQHIEGPRLDDLKGSTADYGTPHPNGLGLTRTASPCFFCEPIKEKKKKRKTKGGKYKEYTYFGTWASMVAGHEISQVRRIWFDKHLVYDATGMSTTSVGDGTDVVETLDGNNTSLASLMRIYLGDEDQEPDPRMLATIEANEGADTCPAYKGIAYIFFEDVPLEKIGNRFPQVEVEFIGAGSDAVLEYDTEDAYTTDPDYGGFRFVPDSISPSGRYVIGMQAYNGRAILDLSDNSSSLLPMPTLGDAYTATAIDDDGTLYGMAGLSVGLYKRTSFGVDAPVLLDNDVAWTVYTPLNMRLFVMPDDSRKLVWGSLSFLSHNAWVYDVDTDIVTELTNPSPTDWAPLWFVTDTFGDLWGVGVDLSDDTTMHFWRVIDNGAGSAAPDHVALTGLPSTANGEFEVYFAADGVFLAWNGFQDLYLLDPDDFSILLHRSYSADVQYGNAQPFTYDLAPGASEFWFYGTLFDPIFEQAASVEKIRASDLTTTASRELADWPIGDVPHALIYSSYTQDKLLSYNEDGTNYIAIRYFTEAGGTLTLGGVNRYFSNLVGLTENTDYIVDASVDAIPVNGYSWTQGTAKSAIDWLNDIYDSTVRPHDGVPQFIARGVSSSFAVETPEFAIEHGQPQDRFKLTVSNDTDLPADITFNFSDMDNDLEPNNVATGRNELATDATGKLSINGTTLTLEATEAQQMVDRYFRSRWFRRITSENRVTNQRLAIEPGDVGTFGFDGLPIKMEVLKARHSADGSIYLESLQYDQALAGLSDGLGSPAMGRPPSTMFNPGDAIGFVLDVPLLSDAHDQSAPFLYIAGGPGDPNASYVGTEFYQSDTGDDETYAAGWAATGSSDPATFGATTTELPDAEHDVIDNASTLTVVLTNGSLSSVTESQMLLNAGLNLALVGNELIQFKTATLTAPLTYNLTGLVRGARGTEHEMTEHAIGDRFLLLDSVGLVTVGAGELGDEDWYIAAAPGASPDPANEFAVDFNGNAHKPYSPSHVTVTRVVDDWEIDGIRRTRVGGSSVNGQDVPLGEVSESWEADIMDGPDVVRVIDGTSLPLVYEEADAIADFGSVPSTLDVVLYQMSPALTLRGFGTEASG